MGRRPAPADRVPRKIRDGPRKAGRDIPVQITYWFIIVGVLLILMALSGSVLKRLPLSTSMLYLGAGVLIGPLAFNLTRFDPIAESAIIERITEVAVIV
ncbi:MAG: potassium/proton antiporter, partial [Thermomicrobiales bacterium]|nr:potassium/proton antiporter [Thermomicrobiales bacterium]